MRTALVTGANRGIGLAIAAGLNRLDGIKVLLASRHADDGEKAAKVVAGNAVAEGVDILVNNAGVLEPQR